jgi:ATP-binding cassette subfamily B protein
MLLQAFVPVGTLWASRGVVNAVTRVLGLAGSGAASLSLTTWIALAVGLIILQQALATLFRATQESLADRLTTFVNGELLAAVNRWRGLSRFEDPTFANHLVTARERAVRGPVDLAAYGGRLAQALFTIVAMGAALWRLHPLAPLLLLLAHIPEALQENDFAQKSGNVLRVQGAEGRKLVAYHAAVLGAETAKDVRLYDLGSFFLGLYGTLFGRMSAEMWALRRQLLARMAPAQALSAGAAAIVYLYAIQRVLVGELTLGDLVLFAGALGQLHLALYEVGFDVGFFAMIFTWLPSLFLVLDAEPDLPHPQPPPQQAGEGAVVLAAVPFSPLHGVGRGWGGALAPRPIRSGLVLEEVSFRYPGAETDMLRQVSFAIRPGERMALVGRNGAGKTTLVKLLCRFYDPTEGRILLDGVDLRDYDLDDLRRQIGVVFQDFVAYQLTAQENVGLGDVRRLEDLAAVQAAARQGGAAALIEALPKGYATRLGSQFGGVNLSGGQWQKIALSRAFMRDAQLLILDEPTAALDVQAEYDVYRRFSELTQDRMTVLVSHRFSTVRMADRIVYLEEGRLVEEGSHEQLLALDGGYAHLYGLQAELYRDEATKR